MYVRKDYGVFRYEGEECEECSDTGRTEDSDTGKPIDYCSNCWSSEYLEHAEECVNAGELLDCVGGPLCKCEECSESSSRWVDYRHSEATEAASRTLADSYNYSAVDAWSVITDIAGCDVDKLLLWGPPGTGKTTLALTAGLNGRKCYPVTLTEDASAESIRGHHVLTGLSSIWMDGAGTAAMRGGDRFLVNEIDKSSGDAADILQLYCDDPAVATVTLPKEDQEVIVPTKGYQVFATTNANPKSLPEALCDRFPLAIHVAEVNEAAIARLPEDLQSVARASSALQDADRRVGIRKWLAFANLRDQMRLKHSDDAAAMLAAYAAFGRDGASVLAQIAVSQ